MKKITRKKFVQEWVKALRSGYYRQTQGQLSSHDSDKHGHYQYCCLGVACLVGQKLNIPGASFDGEASDQYRGGVFPGKWFGKIMKSRDPKIRIKLNEKSKMVYCSDANDEYELKFSKIADALEEKYL
jgi:hypothetical protein